MHRVWVAGLGTVTPECTAWVRDHVSELCHLTKQTNPTGDEQHPLQQPSTLLKAGESIRHFM